MKISKETKITICIILFAAFLLALIIVPIAIKYKNKKIKIDFPEYNNIDITEDILINPEEYEKVKRELENDYYFAKLTIIDEYDSTEYNPVNLQRMIWHFIFNYELSNKDYFTYSDSKNNIYCLNEKNLVKAFEELYDVDITKNLNLLKGYYKYIYINKHGYCMDFNNVSSEYINDIKISIERISTSGTNILLDFYVYEYYNSGDEKEYYIKLLENSINTKNYTESKKIVENYLNGTVKHKQIQVKKNYRGKFFKYKVLNSKILIY